MRGLSSFQVMMRMNKLSHKIRMQMPRVRSHLQSSYCRYLKTTAIDQNNTCLPGSTDKYNGMHVHLTDLSTDMDEEHFEKLLQGMTFFLLCTCRVHVLSVLFWGLTYSFLIARMKIDFKNHREPICTAFCEVMI